LLRGDVAEESFYLEYLGVTAVPGEQQQLDRRGIIISHVCVQLPASAVNATLLAFAAERRAAAHLLPSAGWPAVQQPIDISCPAGAQQQTRSSGVRRSNDGTDRQTDRRTPGLYIDPAASSVSKLACLADDTPLILPLDGLD